ncbi:MAG TPA: DUF1329 domain-containing protein [Candidatus Binatia bacterium]|nr:DUF1329 domain-containing protein [Candidatus Binatia bacterium]
MSTSSLTVVPGAIRSEPFGFAQDRLRRVSGEVEERDPSRLAGLRLRFATLRPNGCSFAQKVRLCANLLWGDLVCSLLFFTATFVAVTAFAKVSPEEAARLDAELTPLGAERAGNAAGTIPPWTGGITEPPPNYKPGDHHPDLYPDDAILFTITAANVEEHAAHLSEGQKALLLTYPDTWRMPVYPTRRSASYPLWVYEAAKANALTAEVVVEGKGGVANATITSPFPIPQSGVEVIWNHNLRWRGIHVVRSNGSAAVTRLGNYGVILAEQEVGAPYGSPHVTPFKEGYPNVMFATKSKIVQPELLAGEGSLIIEPLNQTNDPRKAWIYSQGLRRIVRLPYAAYDFPVPNTDNLQTIDEVGLFNGPPDRFEWQLVGKRELYIPYNAYRLHSDSVTYSDILRQGHINPELARYELHRVWVVEGTLKPGQRHIYSRRIFYVDEDSWQIAVADNYDKDGQLWRVAEAHALNYYDVPVLWTTLEVYHDLKERRYLATGMDNARNMYRFYEDADPRDFSPNALLYYIR